ncbi:MAG: hypothetical protein ACRDG3_06760 [Tepidiformaceae bacterium]
MTTLADIRARTRTDLQDSDAPQRWTDDDLDRHIAHALAELSLAMPQELSATIATTPNSRELSVAALTGLVEVQRVEYPTGDFPPCFVRFTQWGETILLDLVNAPDGADAAIDYTASHTLDGSGSSVPVRFEELLVMGASAYAVLEQSVATIDGLNTGGPAVPEQFAASGRARLTAFGQLLRQYARANRVRSRRLVTPAF